jgi:hypothetical protein
MIGRRQKLYMVAGARRVKDDRKQNTLATILVFFQAPFYGKTVVFLKQTLKRLTQK